MVFFIFGLNLVCELRIVQAALTIGQLPLLAKLVFVYLSHTIRQLSFIDKVETLSQLSLRLLYHCWDEARLL